MIEELKNSSLVDIFYGIDRNVNVINSSIEILTGKDELPAVDIVVVTLVLEFDTIKAELCSKVKALSVSLEEIITEIARMNIKHKNE